jgi:hypothetical protein
MRRMKPDLYTKIVLTAIALLLAVIALRMPSSPSMVRAAENAHYTEDYGYRADLRAMMNKYAASGWEVVTAWSYGDGHVGIIFRK